MLDSMKEKSSLGDTEKEGFVIRVRDGFEEKDFEKNIAKFVRKNHVQTESDWLKKWKQSKLIKK